MARGSDWTPEDYGAALEACCRANGTCRPYKGGKLLVNGWFREGVSPNIIVNVDTGNYMDLKTKQHGIVRDFAHEVYGQSIGEFMAVWGRDPSKPRPPARPKPPPPRERQGVDELWQRLRDGMPPERTDGAARWLTAVRGFPPAPARLVDSGFATAASSQLPVWGSLEQWVAGGFSGWGGMREYGPMIAVPLRDAKSGIVVNIHLRPLNAGKAGPGARRFLPGVNLRDPITGAPRGYGFARAAMKAPLVVLVEGAVDTMVAEAWTRSDTDVVVVGAASASCVRHWSEWLAAKTVGGTIVVPHLDKPGATAKDLGRDGQRAAAAFVADHLARGLVAACFDWDRFHAGVGGTPATVADLGDAVAAAGWDRARAAFLEALGIA